MNLLMVNNHQLDDLYLRNAILTKKTLPAQFKHVKTIDQCKEVIEVAYDNVKVYFYT